ncbi:MAG: hypothetical protein HHAS10_04240 [Candidatus Altimarinota bacterium]
MNYAILKTIIETSLTQYVCQNCSMKSDENSFNLTKVSEGSVDFLVTCPHCQFETHMHAEVGSAQLNNQIPQNGTTNNIVPVIKNKNSIQESDITELEKSIMDSSSIEDLLK